MKPRRAAEGEIWVNEKGREVKITEVNNVAIRFEMQGGLRMKSGLTSHNFYKRYSPKEEKK